MSYNYQTFFLTSLERVRNTSPFRNTELRWVRGRYLQEKKTDPEDLLSHSYLHETGSLLCAICGRRGRSNINPGVVFSRRERYVNVG